MRLVQLAEGCLAVPPRFNELEVTGVTSDSRKVKPGFVFIAVDGEAADGHGFAAHAERAGAVAIVGERWGGGSAGSLRDSSPAAAATGLGAWVPEHGIAAPGKSRVGAPAAPIPYFEVVDSRLALARIGSNFYGNPQRSLALTGITGTKGKTTTAWVLDAILRAAGRTTALLGTVKNRIGDHEYTAHNTTPSTLELQRYLHELSSQGGSHAVLEVSSHGIAQRRIAGLDFRAGILTNIQPEHLDYHGTFECYREAKTRFFAELGEQAYAILPREDPVSNGVANRTPANILWYGADGQDGVERLRMGPGWLSFTWKGTPIRASLWGGHNLQNLLAAMTAAECLGITPEDIAQGVERAVAPPGRLEEVEHSGEFQIFVDYAHTDGALETVLKTLRSMTRGRLICVFGCGGDRDREKRPRMGRVAEKWADQVVVTSDNPRTEDPMQIIDEVCSGFKSAEDAVFEPDRREAIALSVRMARAGDLVLIAGKGHETYQETGDVRLPFDDREVAGEFLRERIPLEG